MSREFSPNSLYRYYRGAIYLTHSLVLDAENYKKCVTYTALQGNGTFVRTLDEFMSEVPEGCENPTGQKYRFELIKNIDNPLETATTEALVAELTKRPDNPYSGVNLEAERENIIIEHFVVGKLHDIPVIDDDLVKSVENIVVIDSVFDTLDDAKKRLNNKPDHTILKRLFLKVFFDK